MSDITNYAYIWYKKDPAKLLDFTPEELEIIYKIILDYSYPCYLANDSIRTMSEADRKELLEHELLFIQKKFEEACLVDVIIKQIPRVLYDLFNLLYFHTNTLDKRFFYQHFPIKQSDPLINTIEEYNHLTFRYTETVKENILKLNFLIIQTISKTTGQNILKLILVILYQQGILVNEESKNIIQEIFLFEKEPSVGYTILYRAAKIELDSLIDGENKRSLSLNMSILSGFIYDKTACTLFLKTNSSINNKIKYTIKKFHIFNKSNEYSLFFIPPIHPFLQLYCEGELWHPRTKIGYDYFDSLSIFNVRNKNIIGIGCTDDFIRDSDYLKSDKTVSELECLYQQYKSTGQISVWQKKYLKYKNKYLGLKKYLPNKN